MKPNKRPAKLVPAHIAHGSEPASFTSSDVAAMQALRSGTANEGQQRHALNWILNKACGLPLWPYRADQRETDIGLGRQFVGQQIVGLFTVKISDLRQREDHGEQPNG